MVFITVVESVFSAVGLIPYIKQITFRLYKFKPVYDDDGRVGDFISN